MSRDKKIEIELETEKTMKNLKNNENESKNGIKQRNRFLNRFLFSEKKRNRESIPFFEKGEES